MLVMAVGPLLRWNRTKLETLVKQLVFPLILAIVLTAVTLIWQRFEWITAISLFVAYWVLLLTLIDWFAKLGNSSVSWWQKAKKLPRNYYGMLIAHLGMAVSLIGILFVSVQSQEEMVRMAQNDSVTLSGYEFVFNGVSQVQGPNYVANRANISVFENGRQVATMEPEKRVYQARTQMMTEASIDAGLFRDLYISLGEQLDDSTWGVRVHVKPFVRWIWLGGIFMMLGGFLSALDKRYRKVAGAKI